MNADVEKAVERLDNFFREYIGVSTSSWQTIHRALRDQEAEIARLRQVPNLIPTSWLDPLLTGPDAVIGKPSYNCTDVECLFNALRKRITAHLGATHNTVPTVVDI